MDLKRMEDVELAIQERATGAIEGVARDVKRIVEETAAAVRSLREMPASIPQLLQDAEAVFVKETQYPGNGGRSQVSLSGLNVDGYLGEFVQTSGARYRIVVAILRLPSEPKE